MKLVVFALAASLGACASPREKDCREVLPMVDAARADPNDADLAKLRAFSARDRDVQDAVNAYAKAVARLVAGPKAQRELVAAMKMKGDAGAFSLSMFDPSRPHAERLVARCVGPKAPSECAALSNALEACITPAKDDTTAEEQLLSCASDFAAVKSPDAATNESIQALAATLRDFEPFARNVGAPAKDVIRAAKEIVPKLTDAQKARPDANKAEMTLRALCAPERR